MRVTLRQMAVFDAVARLGGISQAAREIALTQSAVSTALKELENGLGAQLFHRHSKRLVLNDKGRQLQPRIRSALLCAQDVESTARDGVHRGSLSVGASTTLGTYLLPGVCAAFIVDHPGVDIRLAVQTHAEVVELVDRMAVDVGFIEGPTMRQTLCTSHWLRDELVIFCAPHHPLAARARVTLQDLGEAAWCLQPMFGDVRGVLTRTLLERFDALRVVFESGSIEAIKGVVAGGAGIGCQSRFSVQDELACGALKALHVDGLDLGRQINLVYRGDIQPSALHEAFLQHARASIARLTSRLLAA